ncbi:TIR domain-containing protein [Vibrio sp. SCSIO 43137]|uniref:TIR domain-containing protein n=1 Tax=Vibrio sp. SCSIO 43137 TaxID=3021011 RepID=UPI00230803D5|nr:TIR domain-containing protein [Vibrio sp. SCSIO 43137]WCE31524.1 TIR domain-containing protein [Vibrio sp. SCSIO 43137]
MSIFDDPWSANKRHKTYVSFHHDNDQHYRDRLEAISSDYFEVIASRSIPSGETFSGKSEETIRQIIRDDYLRDSEVTVVLIGEETWQRQHVDWEIAASIRETQYSPNSGLIGILLPTYKAPSDSEFNPKSLPTRLEKNLSNGFAKLYKWSENPEEIQQWIHEAFQRRNKLKPDNTEPNFVDNRTTNS